MPNPGLRSPIHTPLRAVSANEVTKRLLISGRADELDAAGLMELADLHRQRRLWREAVQIWTRLAFEDHALAMERLAKYYEHVRRDPRTALLWSSRLLQVQAEDRQHHRRQARLLERINASS